LTLRQDPVDDRFHVDVAQAGGGALLDSERLKIAKPSSSLEDLHLIHRNAQESASITLSELVGEMIEANEILFGYRKSNRDRCQVTLPL
jgi:hypothetical protein